MVFTGWRAVFALAIGLAVLIMLVVVALWVAIVLFMRLAWPVRRSATLLFAPYFFWVTFAAALNFEIWRLNS